MTHKPVGVAGGGGFTTTLMAAEVVTAPLLSYALAVML
jgi:hypothetical protein